MIYTDNEDRLKESIGYLTDKSRYPKTNRVPIVSPKEQISDEEYNRILSVVLDILDVKQSILVSGKNIKTVNGMSLVGGGNVVIGGSGSGETYAIDSEISEDSENPVMAKAIFAAMDVPKMTYDMYNYLVVSGKVRNRFYSIYDEDDKLQKIYLGKTMIWEARPESNIASVFPIEFPFIFV